MTHLVLADVSTELAGFVRTLVFVYVLLIIARIVIDLVLAFGARPPYSRAFDAVVGFLRDVSEPLLAPFRRIIPPLGPLDLSPIVAIILLQIVGAIVANVIESV